MGIYNGSITGKLVSRQDCVGSLSKGPVYYLIPTDEYKKWGEIPIRKRILRWMKEPVLHELIGEIVKSLTKSTKKPVTIKIRKGFDDDSVNAVEIAKVVEQNGGSGIAIHGRTREQFYSGKADWDIIKKVKESVSIPVIGNGDIDSPQKAKEIFDYTGCDAIMIGRAAQGNPWIFKSVIHYLKTGELLDQPTNQEKIYMALKHLKMLVQNKGEYIAIREMRKHLGWYVKGLPKSSELRVIINKIENYLDMKNLLLEML